jgi:CDP-glycerol glycerophosphotransferase
VDRPDPQPSPACRLSIILCVHNTEPYLQHCLDSISAQADGSIEIIAVDDASTDGSVAVLERHARVEPRLQVLRLATNGGAGPARNAGLAIARGDYIWFVDSDDWVDRKAIARILQGVRAQPDVLLFGWSRVYPDGRSSPCPALDTLARAPAVFTLHDWPRAIWILTSPWNKVVRRDLLLRTGYQFSAGWYQDISFTYLILAAASRISALTDTLVYYRQNPAGAMRTEGRGHLAVIRQWQMVFDLVAKHSPKPDALTSDLFGRMAWHLLEVVKKPERLPPDTWREFASGARQLWRDHAPPRYGVRPTLTTMEQRMVTSRTGIHLLKLVIPLSARARRAMGLGYRPWERLSANPAKARINSEA